MHRITSYATLIAYVRLLHVCTFIYCIFPGLFCCDFKRECSNVTCSIFELPRAWQAAGLDNLLFSADASGHAVNPEPIP